MSTPNPALQAASPFLKQAIDDVIQCATTILTGDAAQIGLRAGPAFGILVNQLALLVPGAINAEQAPLLQQITTDLTALKSKLP